MVGWMVVLHRGPFMPSYGEISFVFLMQLGVIIGLATAYPVIGHLRRRAISPHFAERARGHPVRQGQSAVSADNIAVAAGEDSGSP